MSQTMSIWALWGGRNGGKMKFGTLSSWWKIRDALAQILENNPDYFLPEMHTECIAFTPENFLNYYPETGGLDFVQWCEK